MLSSQEQTLIELSKINTKLFAKKKQQQQRTVVIPITAAISVFEEKCQTDACMDGTAMVFLTPLETDEKFLVPSDSDQAPSTTLLAVAVQK